MKNVFISVIIPVKKYSNLTLNSIQLVENKMKTHYSNYEILVINSGPQVLPSESSQLIELISSLRFIQLTMNTNIENAIAAGIQNAIGDFALVFDPEIDPINIIELIITTAIQKNKILIGHVAHGNYSAAERFLRRIFYGFVSFFLKINFPQNTSNLMVFPRSALVLFNQLSERLVYLKAFPFLIGIEYELYSYTPASKNQHRTLFQKISLSLDLIFSYSNGPIKFASLMAFLACLFNLAYMIYVGFIYVFKVNVAEGWTTLSLHSAFNFFILTFGLSVGLEYLWRISLENKSRPNYVVEHEKRSATMVSNAKDLKNVVRES